MTALQQQLWLADNLISATSPDVDIEFADYSARMAGHRVCDPKPASSVDRRTIRP